MRWKILALIAALLLVSTFASPSKVEARSLVKKARILMVVGIGTNQKAEIYLRSHSHASPLPPGVQGGSFSFRFTISPGSRGEVVCTQTIQATVAATSGLNTLTLETTEGNDKFMVNGEDVAQLDPNCFNNETKRVVIQVGDRRFKLSDNNSPFLATVPVGVRRLKALGYSIYNSSTGETVASSGKVIDSIAFFDTEGSETSQ
jgi:hypothetical protein